MDNFIIEKQSRYDFDKTVEMISAEAESKRLEGSVYS